MLVVNVDHGEDYEEYTTEHGEQTYQVYDDVRCKEMLVYFKL